MAWTFRCLEEIGLADIGFEAEGESVEEVFRGTTQALLESTANPSTVSGGWERAVERIDVDPFLLLFDWLSDLVYWKEAAGLVFWEAPLTLTRKGEVWLLRARLIGTPVDQQAQELPPCRRERGHETSLRAQGGRRLLEGASSLRRLRNS